ncbi:hypothetical protein Tco_0040766 [Tanacetum coccineum]
MTNTRSGMTHAAIEEMINQRVNAALEAHQVNQNLALGNNNGNGNGNNNGNGNGNNNGNGNGNNNGNGNGNDNGDGNENGNGNGNNGGDNGDGNENPNVNGRGGRLVARECTYQDFMKVTNQPLRGSRNTPRCVPKWVPKRNVGGEIIVRSSRYTSKEKGDCLQNQQVLYKMLYEVANNLMESKVKGNAVRNAEQQEKSGQQLWKQSVDNTHPTNYRITGGQNVARAYVAGNNGEKKYEGLDIWPEIAGLLIPLPPPREVK